MFGRILLQSTIHSGGEGGGSQSPVESPTSSTPSPHMALPSKSKPFRNDPLLRSHRYWPPDQPSKNSPSSIPSFYRQRIPFSRVRKRRHMKSTSMRRTAVLPSRRARHMYAIESACFYRPHSPASQDMNSGVEGRGIEQYSSGMEQVVNGTCDNPEDKTVAEIIFKQLNILKRGDYWKHLPPEQDTSHENNNTEESTFEERQYLFRKHNDKENGRGRHNPNVRYEVPWDWRDEEDEEEDNIDGWDSFSWSAFEVTGFFVHEISTEGWICSGIRNNEEWKGSGDMTHQKKVILRLPNKTAALGHIGMYVDGIDLMIRRNNGVLEPCNRRLAPGTIRHDRPSREELVGRILLK